jgi:hypothetical protein
MSNAQWAIAKLAGEYSPRQNRGVNPKSSLRRTIGLHPAITP